jgi:hypothetical protein
MKKMLSVALEDEDVLELCRILWDKDESGALHFMEEHVKGKAVELLEGG